MAQGGAREGAGRKIGSTNRFSRELLAKIKAEGALPLEHLLEIMRDEEQSVRIRLEAAKAAAPYCHHKLSAISVDVTSSEMTHEDWLLSLR